MVSLARLECGRSLVRVPVGSNQRLIGICCFFAKHPTERRKNEEWLSLNQENVSKWSNMCSLFQ